MNLSFTCANYFYSKYYYGRPVASADGATGEGRGCSLSGWMMFSSVGGGAMFTFDPGSTPSTSWATSTRLVPSAVFAQRASITHCTETCSTTNCACGSKLSPSAWMASVL